MENCDVVRVQKSGAGRFVVRADEKLTAVAELERTVCAHLLTEV